MEIQLRPAGTRFHPLIRPWSRRALAGLGQSNVNPTTIFLPGSGAGSGWLQQPGNAASAISGPPVFQQPTDIPPPACSSGPPDEANSAECIALLLSIQKQNMANRNTSNFNFDVATCESNLAENNAQRASLGMPALPDTCSENTYGLTPADTTGGVNIMAGNAAQYVESVTPVAPTAPTVTGGSTTGARQLVFTFTNLSSGNNSVFQVGDRWQIQISGAAPNAAVAVSGGQNGAGGTSNMGTTDSQGNFTTNGQMTAAEVGSWQENWTVGGQSVASFSFTVNPAAGTTSTTGTTGNAPATGGSVTGSMSDLLSKSTTIGGTAIPDWALAAGALVILFLVMKK